MLPIFGMEGLLQRFSVHYPGHCTPLREVRKVLSEWNCWPPSCAYTAASLLVVAWVRGHMAVLRWFPSLTISSWEELLSDLIRFGRGSRLALLVSGRKRRLGFRMRSLWKEIVDSGAAMLSDPATPSAPIESWTQLDMCCRQDHPFSLRPFL
jgi:hypothetical protein